jgi:hypothetical protein
VGNPRGFSQGYRGVWVWVQNFRPLINPYPWPEVQGYRDKFLSVEILIKTVLQGMLPCDYARFIEKVHRPS